MPCVMNGVTVLGSCFRALVPAWDRFFPTGGGLAWIFRFLTKSEGLGDRNVSNKLGHILDCTLAPVLWQLRLLDR